MTSRLPPLFTRNLALPVFVAPMFLVSGPEMVIASCKAGLGCAFPAPNARTLDDLRDWLSAISTAVDDARAAAAPETPIAPWALNMVVHRTYPRLAAEVELVQEFKPPVVITALGSPRQIVDAVHAYGGLVFADVNSVSFARKAAEAGVDGLVLVGAGAGGHTGPIAGFAFVAEVRKFWDGPIALAGAISDGRAVRAAEVLGADLAYMGTRFVPARESLVADAYRDMLVNAGAEDIVLTDAITGVPANFLIPSLVANGYDPKNLTPRGKIDFSGDPLDERKAWKHMWAAGQGVGVTTRVQTIAEIAEELSAEYAATVEEGRGANVWMDRKGRRQAAA